MDMLTDEEMKEVDFTVWTILRNPHPTRTPLLKVLLGWDGHHKDASSQFEFHEYIWTYSLLDQYEELR